MPDVKIKKSVLQSIIRKSLKESDRTSDPSRRLTVGPEKSALPSLLPLTPSDRMSTQLDIERPPVEDPEYVPTNVRELGYAVQALAEMVPDDQVEKAYLAFQRIIEQLEEEGSDDEEVQLESLRRKNAILGAMLREAEGEGDDDDDDFELSPEEEEEFARLEREEATGPDAMFFKYERVLNAYGLSRNNFMDLHRLVRTRELTQGDLEDFLELLGSLQNDAAIVAKVGAKLRSPSMSEDAMLRFISRFKDEQGERIEREQERATATARPAFEYQTAAKKYGYSGASGLRQAFLRDVATVTALENQIVTRDSREIANGMVERNFNQAIRAPENQEFLKTLFDEEGLEEYLELMNDPTARSMSDIFRNFAGLVRYEALSRILDFKFKPISGQPQRTFGDALAANVDLARPGEGPPSEREMVQIRSLVRDDTYLEIVDEILETSRDNGHRGLLAAAAAMSADDADFAESGEYASAAFSTMKKAASVAKPPELHIADYMGKDDPMVAQVKAADRAARKASRR
jgi:hypothetical protein